MERALSAALLKTTGDEKFRKGAEEEEAAGGGQEESTGQFATRERPRYEADLKYRVPQLGDIDSSAHVRRHTHRLDRTHTTAPCPVAKAHLARVANAVMQTAAPSARSHACDVLDSTAVSQNTDDC